MKVIPTKSKYTALSVVAFMLFFLVISASAQISTSQASPTTPPDPVSVVDTVLCSMGLGCSQQTSSPTPGSTGSRSTSQNGINSSGTSNGGLFGFGRSRSTQGILYGTLVSKAFTGSQITLVRVAQSDSVPGELRINDQIYEIINGKKHLIPTLDVFFDYKFQSQQVQFITREQLDKYASVNLFRVKGDKTKAVYYLTQNGMIRRLLNQRVFDSYGDRSEDIIEISRKEFNFYPEIRYIYLERPFTGDVYLVVGDAKRFLTPMAVRRMGVSLGLVAPINEVEFNEYKIGEPVVF